MCDLFGHWTWESQSRVGARHCRALGSGGMALFMHQFEMGNGDYTRDRDQILGNSTLSQFWGKTYSMSLIVDSPASSRAISILAASTRTISTGLSPRYMRK
jgi:hypothetical protein